MRTRSGEFAPASSHAIARMPRVAELPRPRSDSQQVQFSRHPSPCGSQLGRGKSGILLKWIERRRINASICFAMHRSVQNNVYILISNQKRRATMHEAATASQQGRMVSMMACRRDLIRGGLPVVAAVSIVPRETLIGLVGMPQIVPTWNMGKA